MIYTSSNDQGRLRVYTKCQIFLPIGGDNILPTHEQNSLEKNVQFPASRHWTHSGIFNHSHEKWETYIFLGLKY